MGGGPGAAGEGKEETLEGLRAAALMAGITKHANILTIEAVI